MAKVQNVFELALIAVKLLSAYLFYLKSSCDRHHVLVQA